MASVMGRSDVKSSREILIFKSFMGTTEVPDESVVVDGNIVTGQGLGATIPFALELVKKLVSEEKAEQIKKAICYRG